LKILIYFIMVAFLLTGILGCGSEQSVSENKEPNVANETKDAEAEKKQQDEMHAFKKASEDATRDLNDYLESFRLSEVSWLSDTDVFEVKIGKGQNVVEVKTSLYPDAEGKQMAEDKLTGIWGWANSNSKKVYIDYAKVFDQNGDVLLTKRN